MFLFRTMLTTVVGAAFAAVMFLGFHSSASAAPPDGLKYSDLVNRTGWFANRSTYAAPRYYGYAPSVASNAPIAGSPAMTASTPSQPTVAIRGPDGVVRNYPVVGGVQQSVPPFVSTRGADGVVRSYPVVNGTSPVISESGVISYPCHPHR
jgi:hypothetical protein